MKTLKILIREVYYNNLLIFVILKKFVENRSLINDKRNCDFVILIFSVLL